MNPPLNVLAAPGARRALRRHPRRGQELRGEIGGDSVAALRRGTTIERITEWDPERKLTFVVVRDILGMREISPYRHVSAPHVAGYFLTNDTSFELLPFQTATQKSSSTSHRFKRDPLFF